MDPTDAALLGLRVWLGVVMIAHGVNHGRNLDGTALVRGQGIPARSAQRTGLLGCRAGDRRGPDCRALTSIAAAGLTATMVVAFGSIHRFAGFFVFARPDEGYEYVATLTVAATALAMLGPGSVSLDAVTGLARTLDGWAGLALAVGGAVAGVAQLAALWRRPAGSAPRNTIEETVP